ncbi:MAG: glucose-1-phosphate thymidylyltransferase [Balneolaceae bacterium]|nr:MAG: glucose-1-phosphate thymidylyltransferase [Balneolaceae bacterium]
MYKTCCFFEDDYLDNFHPLTLTRPVYDLRIGISTLGEKWASALGVKEKLIAGKLRSHLKGVFHEPKLKADQHDILWINPRFLPEDELIDQIISLKQSEAIFSDDTLVAAKVSIEEHKKWIEYEIDTTNLKPVPFRVQLRSLEYSWEMFQQNGEQIKKDITRLNVEPVNDPSLYPDSRLIHPDRIYIEASATIEPGAILLAEKGPIYVGKNAVIMANSVVRGPSAICEDSVVKMGAKIYEETTIGPVCKVGGEIANVIFHSYSNKSHDGYAGNSVFGQWCNLGADTNTSNLKNNYSTVKVMSWNSNKQIDTGQQFIGTIMGDHSKTGINSMLNTGTLCGVCCNLFSDKYPPKFVPSFSWVSGNEIVPYHFEKAIEAMERMMKRRSVDLTPRYKNMMKAIFNSTSF